MPLTSPRWNPRGSEWHRWDPHIHAPGTVLEDGFAGDWEAYLDKIETAIPMIGALGVTDYYSIETYREVLKWKAIGRLSNVQFLFPNVEMRLGVKTARQKGINIHLLFSPDDTNHEQEIERVLSHLTFESKSIRVASKDSRKYLPALAGMLLVLVSEMPSRPGPIANDLIAQIAAPVPPPYRDSCSAAFSGFE
jgi:hypothetical protein